MKYSTIYRRAAIKVFNSSSLSIVDLSTKVHIPACTALRLVSMPNQQPCPWDTKVAFSVVFKPHYKLKSELWFGNVVETKEEARLITSNRNHRVFALLFMEQLAKDAGL